MQDGSGETILSREFAAVGASAVAGARAARSPVHHECELELDPSMRPVTGTLRLLAPGGARLRITDPTGHAIHDARHGNPFDPSRSHFRIEPASAGVHRFELDIAPGGGVVLELRRNTIIVPVALGFAFAGILLLGLLILMVRFAAGLHGSAMRRVDLLQRGAAAERDGTSPVPRQDAGVR